jgi:DNA invertase Pin-like site-specific DNA recombinase
MLKQQLSQKSISIVSKELPTSWIALNLTNEQPDFTVSMTKAINTMMLDMLAVIARKHYEDRRRRQLQGIEKAKREGRYRGKSEDTALHNDIKKLLEGDEPYSYSKIIERLGCSRATVAKVSKRMKCIN